MGRISRYASVVTAFSPAALVAALTLTLATPAAAQIVINEIYPDPAGTDDPLERVEIYNAGNTTIDVTGWCIHDAATIDGNPAPARCWLPEDFDATCGTSPIMFPGEYRLVHSRTVVSWLNNGGDDIYLCSNRTIPATVVQLVTYPTAVGHTDETWACIPNGSTNFGWHAKTLCGSNGGVGDVVAPGTVADLTANPGDAAGEMLLRWTAPGDDGATGTATLYHIKISNAPITSGNFAGASEINLYVDEHAPKAGGAAESLYVFGLTPGNTYYFALIAQDEVPNTSGVSNSPGSTPQAGALLNPDLGYTAYFGNLHSHTSYSDGVQTPPDAYTFAHFNAQTPLDFLAVTDHNHHDLGMTPALYAQGLQQAAAANSDGNFVAIYGQEWGIISGGGHVNMYEFPVLFGWEAGQYDVFVAQSDYPSLYTAAAANPPASYPPILEWAHPATSDFNNMAVTNDGKALVHLIALVNGPAFSTSTTESDIGNTGFDDSFNLALQKGYRVSPTGDQDNHNATWGNSTESRTAVLALAKTKQAILTALADRRCYATQDHNVVVQFSADGHAMGTAFTSPTGVRIKAHVTDPDGGDAVAAIDLFRGFTGGTSAVRVAGNLGSPDFDYRELQSFTGTPEVHYYLRIRMADNANIWTGPVYVTYDPNFTAGVIDGPRHDPGLSLSASPNPSSAEVNASFSVARTESRATLAVYDPAGRLVRMLHDGPLEQGDHRLTWDGLTDQGVRARVGLFFMRLETGSGAVSRRIVLLH